MTIDLMRLLAIPALFLLVACENPVKAEEDEHEEEVAGVLITEPDGTVLAEYAEGAWTGGVTVAVGSELDVEVWFAAEDGDRFQLPASGADHTLRVIVADPAIAEFENHGNHAHVAGLAQGSTSAVVQVYHGSHADFETNPGFPITVAP